MKTLCYLYFLLCLPLGMFAQDDLWSEIDKKDTLGDVNAAFKGLKIVNFESTKLAAKKDFHFIVSHRFASIKYGFDDFFGLDEAVTRIQFVYGISDGLNIGISRSSYQKVYDLSLKYRILTQKEGGLPFTLSGYSILGINTFLDKDFDPDLSFGDKLSFTTQALISRKFTEKLSLELIPTFLYENYVFFEPQDKAQFALGVGGRYKLGKRWSVNMDYGWHLNRADNSPYRNPLSIGVDIETGGHVFQIHFTNAQPMTESGFLGQGAGDWGDGDIFFGFNLTRIF